MKVARILGFSLIISALMGVQGQRVDAEGSKQCHIFTFDATGSHDPDTENLSYRWDFGDGATSTEAVIKHEYTVSGDYTVSLTISDNSTGKCSSATATQTVLVNIPPEIIVDFKDHVCTNESFILDAVKTLDDSQKNLSYQWDFGDGGKASDKAKVSKVYKNGGKYTVTLVVDDKSGTDCSSSRWEDAIYVNEPPAANAGVENVLKCIKENTDLLINFDASNTTDANNDPLVYQWDFGDGESAQGPKVTHQYKDIGNYDVKLIVSDGTNYGCSTSVDFVSVRLNQSPLPNAGNDVTACPDESVEFDASNSEFYKKGTVSAEWSFGDGQKMEGMNVVHSYDRPGNYQAILSLQNHLNDMCPPAHDTRNVSINATPGVSLKNLDSVCAGSKVEFDASSAVDPDGDALEYYWTFGDGAIVRADSKVSHEYQQGGKYRVTVIVDDGKKTSCSTATAVTDVKVNTPPIADAGPNSTCCVDNAVEFSAKGSSDPDGDTLTYTWDFGDGTKEQGEVVSHAYAKSGSYNVNLTVDDNSNTPCSKSSTGFVAEVNAAPVPVINIR